LVNFVVNLPTELKIRRGWTKYILRAALPEMPAALRWRRDKQGFLVPEELWLKRDLVPAIQRRFRASTLSELDILNDREFLLYYDHFRSGKSIISSDIARILIAEIWAEKFLHSNTAASPHGVSPQAWQPHRLTTWGRA
jgi:asparagine synthase (glutamine-hydrolysing)